MGIKEFCPCEAADPAFPDITSLAFVIIYLLAATTISFRKRKPTAFGFASPTPICLCGVCVDLCVFTCAWCTCTHVWRLKLRSRRVHHSSFYPLGQGLSVEAVRSSALQLLWLAGLLQRSLCHLWSLESRVGHRVHRGFTAFAWVVEI